MTAGRIVREVSGLLSHFFRPGEADEVRAVAEKHWVMALSDLPGWAVKQALDETAVESTVRPTPAAVRKRAIQHAEPYSRELTKRKAAEEEPPRVEPSEESKARIAALVRGVVGRGGSE